MAYLLLETGDKLLLESGDFFLLENSEDLSLYVNPVDIVEIPIATVTGTQNSAEYLVVSCLPSEYQTVVFQPESSWSLNLPYLSIGDNSITIIAYNGADSVTAEFIIRYEPEVQLATSTISLRPYVMTASGLIPMGARYRVNNKAVVIDVRLGCGATSVSITGVSAVGSCGELIASPVIANVNLTGVSAVGGVGTVVATTYTAVNITPLVIYPFADWYGRSATYTAPGGQQITQVYISVTSVSNIYALKLTSADEQTIYWTAPSFNFTGWVQISPATSIKLVAFASTTTGSTTNATVTQVGLI